MGEPLVFATLATAQDLFLGLPRGDSDFHVVGKDVYCEKPDSGFEILPTRSVQGLIRLEMRKWIKNWIVQVLVSSSSLVSGLSEAFGVKLSWGEVSQ